MAELMCTSTHSHRWTCSPNVVCSVILVLVFHGPISSWPNLQSLHGILDCTPSPCSYSSCRGTHTISIYFKYVPLTCLRLTRSYGSLLSFTPKWCKASRLESPYFEGSVTSRLGYSSWYTSRMGRNRLRARSRTESWWAINITYRVYIYAVAICL
jgi:hypothetical protein